MTSRISVSPLNIAERRIVSFDFAAEMPVGVTISSSSGTSSVYSGVDATPDIVNSLANSGTIVSVNIGGPKPGTLGVIYDLLVSATLSDGQILYMAAYIAFTPSLPAVAA